jgi:hypothetical protein
MGAIALGSPVKAIQELNETIKKNSKITEKQNIIMIVLTVGIFAMTAVMIGLMILQFYMP